MSHQFVPCGQCKQSDDLSQPGSGVCPKCQGKGTLAATCASCQGSKILQHFRVTCGTCGGKGKAVIGKRQCNACLGKGKLTYGQTCHKCSGGRVIDDYGTCVVCDGKGDLPDTCHRCAGSGFQDSPCMRCGGSGNCSGCSGTGWIRPIIVRGR